MSLMAGDRLLSPREVADLAGVSTITVRRWISEGQLEAVRLGGTSNAHLRVTEQAIERFLRPVGEAA